jgi:hypothetical protein
MTPDTPRDGRPALGAARGQAACCKYLPYSGDFPIFLLGDNNDEPLLKIELIGLE